MDPSSSTSLSFAFHNNGPIVTPKQTNKNQDSSSSHGNPNPTLSGCYCRPLSCLVPLWGLVPDATLHSSISFSSCIRRSIPLASTTLMTSTKDFKSGPTVSQQSLFACLSTSSSNLECLIDASSSCASRSWCLMPSFGHRGRSVALQSTTMV
jgi:hypothetical protein